MTQRLCSLCGEPMERDRAGRVAGVLGADRNGVIVWTHEACAQDRRDRAEALRLYRVDR